MMEQSDFVKIVSHENNQISQEAILRLLSRARFSIRIASSSIRNFKVRLSGDSFFLSIFFRLLVRKGISLKLLTTPKGFRSYLVREIQGISGVEVKACARNHLKLIIVDNLGVYIGTANLTSAGLGFRPNGVRNFEVGFITYSTEIVSVVEEIFEKIWRGSFCDSCLYSIRRKNFECMAS